MQLLNVGKQLLFHLPAGIELFTKRLFRKVSAAVVGVAFAVINNAAQPKFVPPEFASKCTVLKEIFTVVVTSVALKFIPLTCGAVFGGCNCSIWRSNPQ